MRNAEATRSVAPSPAAESVEGLPSAGATLFRAVSRGASGNGLGGERLEVSMGPQHPSTHGVLRFVVRADGEIMREPLTASNRSRILSRSRKAYMSGAPDAPMSWSRKQMRQA